MLKSLFNKGFLLLAILLIASPAAAYTTPTLPSANVTEDMPDTTGYTTKTLKTSGGDYNLTQLCTAIGAIPNGHSGYILEIDANATATMSSQCTFPNYTGTTKWVIIRTSGVASLPAAGTRLIPCVGGNPGNANPAGVTCNTNLANMATIQCTASDGSPCGCTAKSAHHFRFVGIHWTTPTTQPVGSKSFGFMDLAVCTGSVASLSEYPDNFIFDRNFFEGAASYATRHPVRCNASNCAVVDSWCDNVRDNANIPPANPQDTQCVSVDNSPGPILIRNNFFEAETENFITGGGTICTACSPNVHISDVTIRRNYFYKRSGWNVAGSNIKNLLELKEGKRFLIEQNIIGPGSYVSQQNGSMVVITVRNQNGNNNWATISDVTFRWNWVRGGVKVFSIHGGDSDFSSQLTYRIEIKNNLFTDINGPSYGGSGTDTSMGLFNNRDTSSTPGGISDLAFVHNTGVFGATAGYQLFQWGDGTTNVNSNCTIKDNIFTEQVPGTGTFWLHSSELNTKCGTSTWDVQSNAMIGGPPSGLSYTGLTNMYTPANNAAVRFANTGTNDYRLCTAAASPDASCAGVSVFKSGQADQATDGTDLGMDATSFATKIQGVETGAAESGGGAGGGSTPTASGSGGRSR